VGDPTDYDQALGTLRLPVLMVSLSGDAFVPKSCADFLARKLKQASVTQVELQARDYGLPTFHHFRWTRKPDPVLDQVDQWVRTAIGQAASARASAGA
jgi:predicted alpha/beta hydrolase